MITIEQYNSPKYTLVFGGVKQIDQISIANVNAQEIEDFRLGKGHVLASLICTPQRCNEMAMNVLANGRDCLAGAEGTAKLLAAHNLLLQVELKNARAELAVTNDLVKELQEAPRVSVVIPPIMIDGLEQKDGE